MELYSARILLNGSRDNEVRRDDLTAAEVLILKEMHGPEHVLDIRIVGKAMVGTGEKARLRTQSEERKRLLGIEGEIVAIYKTEHVRKVFPSDMTPLPEALPAEMIDLAGMEKDAATAPAVVKPVEAMSAEEIDTELTKLDMARKHMAKVRAGKGKRAEEAQQSATMD